MNINEKITEMKDIIQDCHLNFLLGSGMSMPYLPTLGNIEELLTALSMLKESGGITRADNEKIIRVSLYKKYFDEVISKNLNLLRKIDLSVNVLNEYEVFLRTLNSIVLNRRTPILNRQINLFTTNIDIFLEKALDRTNVEYNDGFRGRFNPIYNSSNFRKSFFKTSLYFDNKTELPVFNLYKLHGSLTWNKNTKGTISFSSNLDIVNKIKSKKISSNKLLIINNTSTIEELIKEAENKKVDTSFYDFINEYEKLAIVNPSKEKFKETVLNRNYYELLRIFSNEMEKENSILFVMGFSFADEHIRGVTKMVADSNPTLKIYIFSHTSNISEGMLQVFKESKNRNVEIITPNQIENEKKEMVDEYYYDFNNINTKIFNELLMQINEKEKRFD